MSGPLAGYRALDLADHRGTLAGRLPADLGKRRAIVDLESDSGRATARCLAAAADCVLESLPPGQQWPAGSRPADSLPARADT